MDNSLEQFKAYYIDNWRKCLTFRGRTGRGEFWYFYLLNFLIAFGITVLEMMVYGSSFLGGIIFVFPSIAIAVRRLHDTGNYGGVIVIPYYNLYLFLKKGDENKNEYGKAVSQTLA